MPNLYLTFALPNPSGKDRPRHGTPSNAQLNSEWMEFANMANHNLDMSGVALCHYTFTDRCQKTGEDQLTTFNGELAAGHSIRVHSGSGQPSWEGTVRHLYLNRTNYAWNNRCGDTAVLRNAAGTLVDWASYDSNPLEGQVLRRQQNTNRLI